MATTEQQPRAIKRFLRLPAVLDRMGIGRASWYLGMSRGSYPQPTKLNRISVWLEKRHQQSDLAACLEGQRRVGTGERRMKREGNNNRSAHQTWRADGRPNFGVGSPDNGLSTCHITPTP